MKEVNAPKLGGQFGTVPTLNQPFAHAPEYRQGIDYLYSRLNDEHVSMSRDCSATKESEDEGTLDVNEANQAPETVYGASRRRRLRGRRTVHGGTSRFKSHN